MRYLFLLVLYYSVQCRPTGFASETVRFQIQLTVLVGVHSGCRATEGMSSFRSPQV